MSFSFGFSGDDIDQEVDDADDAAPTTAIQSVFEDKSGSQELSRAQVHSLNELLDHLPSQLSCNNLSLPPSSSSQGGPSVQIVRRSLFDIRTQLMAESSSCNDNDALIANLSSGDLSSGTYEGGFKTWECAIDLASFLVEQPDYLSENPTSPVMHIVELGAGSAIPSLAVLRHYLADHRAGEAIQAPLNYRVTLADYNADVLKLCTAPNVLLNVLQSQQAFIPEGGQDGSGEQSDYEYDLEAAQSEIENLTASLRSDGIAVDFISGAWGDSFVNLVHSNQTSMNDRTSTLVLASETIYAPGTLPLFTSTLLALISRGQNSKALVAAKRIYFGVGGGVAEFERELYNQEPKAIVRTIWETKGGDTVGRVILEISLPRGA